MRMAGSQRTLHTQPCDFILWLFKMLSPKPIQSTTGHGTLVQEITIFLVNRSMGRLRETPNAAGTIIPS